MNTEMMIQGVAAFAALGLYFLPSIIADRRKRYDMLTLALFNACMGWTVFGWLIAMYWAWQPNPPVNLEGEVVRSRRIISMRTFTKGLSERVRMRESRDRSPK
ncbi:immunity protein [Paraburkholderia caribensis MBA4]|uniref:Immunity protein n=1 Tax=Paraburkholderia caribensis MBA4 TaxID=1323664 RepID=A0A0N7JUK7_9BURK|nr:superinfection immunity protein [Paraburkholderia caribensis]ALL66685.1 immunity protein [Paraburkholderia caribensis MBA4]